MKTKKEAIEIVKILKEFYPDAVCSLDFETPFQMLISVMLAAQCTDERVNKTTPALFNQYDTPEKMAKIDLKELEEIIHPCGFYKNKAKNIKACSQKLIDEFEGKVPENMEDLQSLPGVGRKSANVVMLEAFHNLFRRNFTLLFGNILDHICKLLVHCLGKLESKICIHDKCHTALSGL